VPRIEEFQTRSDANPAQPVEAPKSLHAPTRPNGFPALATTSVLASATTGAQVRPNDERAPFASANAYTVEPPNDRARDIAPEEDYGDDDGAPVGPSEEEEAAFLAEDSSSHFSDGASESSTHSSGMRLLATSALASAATGVQARAAHVEDDEKNSGPLPSLEALRGRISPEILGLMEELFRAKLTRVTRVSKRDLKEAKRLH